jgi:hypothetical protein
VDAMVVSLELGGVASSLVGSAFIRCALGGETRFLAIGSEVLAGLVVVLGIDLLNGLDFTPALCVLSYCGCWRASPARPCLFRFCSRRWIFCVSFTACFL